MEEKRKNEELKSRREFFKEAAKKTLPVLGAIVLASSPIIANAAQKDVTDCSFGCTGECVGGCVGNCKGDCSGDCKNRCTGTCKAYCKEECFGTCQSCFLGCTDSCGYTCSRGAK